MTEDQLERIRLENAVKILVMTCSIFLSVEGQPSLEAAKRLVLKSFEVIAPTLERLMKEEEEAAELATIVNTIWGERHA